MLFPNLKLLWVERFILQMFFAYITFRAFLSSCFTSQAYCVSGGMVIPFPTLQLFRVADELNPALELLKFLIVNIKQIFDTTTLANRREKLCESFAIKNLKSENSFFSLVNRNLDTRSKPRKVKEFRCRTTRYQKSSLPYMAKLLNK